MGRRDAHDDARLMRFYAARFRPDFARAVDAWVATRPLKNPDAPLTPFQMPQYRQPERREAAALDAQAAAHTQLARRNVQRSTNYVLCVVLFASALFFAGISTKLDPLRLRMAFLAIGTVIFVARRYGWSSRR